MSVLVRDCRLGRLLRVSQVWPRPRDRGLASRPLRRRELARRSNGLPSPQVVDRRSPRLRWFQDRLGDRNVYPLRRFPEDAKPDRGCYSSPRRPSRAQAHTAIRHIGSAFKSIVACRLYANAFLGSAGGLGRRLFLPQRRRSNLSLLPSPSWKRPLTAIRTDLISTRGSRTPESVRPQTLSSSSTSSIPIRTR